ncbi:Nitrogenase FeMo-cofactor synthesis molybdenum delivery protein NifQ [Paramagnetospirillum magnetotacticum MS-1]|uniref:Nitrogenase FeMo-cofactor synthesis molybdenum delivery protein NifQ n=1 Tax=Paramagnetospirillum magnetotacticum MS-1 TaxID=272627 RepID=A0A0C2YXQ0_PARME|nr:nitrogen fixation protein NifQ [Paramagnetospirillum magnetotacticum]KIL99475.1 Nitrogenase FeMo-cofactor synthesis molybdenum delivery protein NifQ [Paramagnetospirillum magnetotacticum MS-1]
MTFETAKIKDPSVYERLMAAESAVDPLDRHVLASVIAAAWGEGHAPLTEALGLGRSVFARLLDAVFPHAYALGDLVSSDANAGEDSIEEPDYRALLLDGRARGDEIEDWLAHVVARRSLKPEHLWVSLGLRNRKELSDMLHRHFPKVAARNVNGMRWKKFFYREMCMAEGVYVCKSPVCDICPDYSECYGGKD